MNKYLKIFLLGLSISFVGTLPLGTLNITTFHIAATKNITEALFFIGAAVAVELIVVMLTLSGANRFKSGVKTLHYLLLPAAALMVYLSVNSFLSAQSSNNPEMKTTIFPLIHSSIILGFVLSAINPLHIPFWAGWNSYLLTNKSLDNSKGMISLYMIAVAAGSIAGFLVFVFAGQMVFSNYYKYSMTINIATGSLYLIFAGYLLIRFYKNNLRLTFQE